MRIRVLFLCAVVAVAGLGCGLFKIKKGGGEPSLLIGAAPPTRGPTRKIRYALLAPYEQVAAAATAEIKAQGATSLESAGDDSLRFIIRDELESGEDFITLRQEGTILVVTFRLHKVVFQGGGAGGGAPENPGIKIKRKNGGPQEIENPGKGAGPGPFAPEGKPDESSAAKKRRDRIVHIIRCLPGVGDIVSSDGTPKERQFIAENRADCHLGGGASTEDGGTSSSLPPPTNSSDAGTDAN